MFELLRHSNIISHFEKEPSFDRLFPNQDYVLGKGIGNLIQYIGRIQRSKNPPVIFDYRDSKIDYFEKMFKQRKRYYNKLLK